MSCRVNKSAIRKASLLAIASAVLSCLSQPVLSTTWIVTDTSDSTTDTGSLRYAINNAASGDTIDLSQLCTGSNATINLAAGNVVNDITSYGASEFVINKNLTIEDSVVNPLSNYGVTINASGDNARLFTVASGASLTLKNITLTGGSETGGVGYGGYDYPYSGGGGGAGLGGAVFNQGGTVSLSGVTIAACAATGGAGGVVFGNSGGAGGTLGGAGSSFYGGFGTGGAGQSSITGSIGGFGGGGGGANTSGKGGNGGFGGGQGSRGALDGILVVCGGGGGAGLGGAIFDCSGTVNLTNCTLTANSAVGGVGGSSSGYAPNGGDGAGYGGAIFSLNGTVAFTNDTISGNTAAQGGAGIFAYSGTVSGTGTVPVGSTGIFNMTNTIVGPIDDLAVSGSPFFSGSNNIVCNNAAGFPSAGISSTSDPLLGPLASNGGPTQTMLPGSGSPAISAGTTLGAPSTDQRGAPATASLTSAPCKSPSSCFRPASTSPAS